MFTVSSLKKYCTNSIIFGTPNLYFCAVCKMDFDGPDYAGPPISDIVKTYYKGQAALVLVYCLRRGGEDKTSMDALKAVSEFGLPDSAVVLLRDSDTGETVEVTSAYSALDMLLFLSAKTKMR